VLAVTRVSREIPAPDSQFGSTSSARTRSVALSDYPPAFTSSILPKWARRTKSLDALLPVL